MNRKEGESEKGKIVFQFRFLTPTLHSLSLSLFPAVVVLLSCCCRSCVSLLFMKKKVGMEGKRNEGSHADASQVSLDDKKGSRVPPSSRETTAREEAEKEEEEETKQESGTHCLAP